MNNLVIEYVDVLSLNPNDYNPNNHEASSFDLLLNSLKKFGFTQPIVVQKNTNIIIDGEHRWRVACILNYEKVPVIFLDLNETDMKLATIIHNRARGKENKELINSIYESINFDTKILDTYKLK